jgi:uncharacterized lipoprotein YddW (UPF0748 family)
VINNAADMGITDVFFQVRGRADAFYNSNFEPRNAGVPANFDPLQTAINAAHARGVKLHAWLNATPMWQANVGEPPAGHIAHNTDPSFRLQDINGNLEPLTGWSNYSSVNPVLPEVHTHLNNVVNDIASNYAIDGIHLDYIRYVPGALNFERLPHDPIAHQMFQDATGLDAGNAANFQAYKSFVKNRITDLVGSIKSTVDAAEVSTGREMPLTASVWRDPDVGENDYIQDYRTWLEQDLLDVAMPMIYLRASNDNLFNPNLLNSLNIPTNSRVAPTLGVYLHDEANGGVDLTISQLQRAHAFGADGVAFYGYGSLFSGPLAAARRTAIQDFFANLAEPNEPGVPGPGNVIDDFEQNEGHFGWAYNQSPITQTFGLTAATTIERVTTTAQGGVASQELNLDSTGGVWGLRHNSGIGSVASPSGNTPLDPTGSIGFWLKTDDAGITVQIGIDDPTASIGDGSTALEKGIARSVIADGNWHLYQWDLEDDDHWNAFAGFANGQIDGVFGDVSIDSIFFSGSGDAQIYLDTVSHNSDGPLAAVPIPGDFNSDGTVDGDDLALWKANFGEVPAGPEILEGDSDADGDVDGADFLVWQRNLTAAPAAAAAGSVPEPGGAGLMVLAVAVLAGSRRFVDR